MIRRDITNSLQEAARFFPVVAIIGPRQSGKTTLSCEVFKNHTYISLEDLDKQEFVNRDPRGFLELYRNDHGIILDEIQQAPSILSYIQTYVDTHNVRGYFVVTGSQNFLVNEAITQTLAGRMAIFTLLPLSCAELKHGDNLPKTIEEFIYKGAYPRVYKEEVPPTMWYNNYIKTYLERDVRTLETVDDLLMFKRFIQLCAGRIGQLLNVVALANDAGLTVARTQAWLSLLQASYLLFFLQPHHKNFNKRLVKAPKLYFYDTGLACALLGIDSWDQVVTHYLRGGLVESFVMAELSKTYYNANKEPRLYFWRDNHGHEVDGIIEYQQKLIPVEVKAGKTINQDFFSGIDYWKSLEGNEQARGYIVYGGSETQKRTAYTVVSWHDVASILAELQSR